MASSSRKLPLLLSLLAVVVAAFHASAAAPVPVPAPPAAQKYCGDTLAGLKACGSFVFGGAAAKPSRACCAAYAAVYASAESLCLCYLDDGTFWRAVGYGGGGGANATAGDDSSFMIPESCGQVGQPPIEFRCEESGPDDIPPYGPQGSPAQPPAISAGGPPTARPPPESGGGPEVNPPYGPQSTPAAQPPISSGAAGAPPARPPPPSAHSVNVGSSTAKARRDSSPELLVLLVGVAIAALCSTV
ncbi:unnamed protein product [Urochloa decumbens]|uniref:Bifunctional inhibitor/plant lipid transfer protein/seed storage helical domain-containing protein n=1 Tax=Urochloa decumbens TaxID=240449 RepID=A0ABC9AVX4_9POAL